MCDPGVSSEMICFSTEHVHEPVNGLMKCCIQGHRSILKAAIVKNPGITITVLSADDRLAFNGNF